MWASWYPISQSRAVSTEIRWVSRTRYVIQGSPTFHADRIFLVLYGKDHGSPDIHFGFRVNSRSQVDQWRAWLKKKQISIMEDVKEHNFRSVKFRDPDGHCIEISHER